MNENSDSLITVTDPETGRALAYLMFVVRGPDDLLIAVEAAEGVTVEISRLDDPPDDPPARELAG